MLLDARKIVASSMDIGLPAQSSVWPRTADDVERYARERQQSAAPRRDEIKGRPDAARDVARRERGGTGDERWLRRFEAH